jgi:hypothetical protein
MRRTHTHAHAHVRSSAIRPFRLAATLAGSRIVSALVEGRKRRAAAAATAQYQLESESKKGRAANQVRVLAAVCAVVFIRTHGPMAVHSCACCQLQSAISMCVVIFWQR